MFRKPVYMWFFELPTTVSKRSVDTIVAGARTSASSAPKEASQSSQPNSTPTEVEHLLHPEEPTTAKKAKSRSGTTLCQWVSKHL
jgi:hypothetical protein